jgi:hypothetical protein
MLSLFPICLLANMRHRMQVIGLSIFSLIAVVEHSYWSTVLRQLTAQELHQRLLSGQPTYYVFLTLQLLLLLGYGWLLAAALRRIASPPLADA